MGDVFDEIMKKQDRLDKDLNFNRKNSRDVIYKIILISASIVAFSVSLASIEFLNNRINLLQLYFSWKLFLGVIILGFLLLFLEPRLEHAKAWRHFLLYQNVTDEEMKRITRRQKIKIYWILFKSILQPENLYFGKPSTKEREHEDKVLSFLLLDKMAKIRWRALFWSENIFIILFIISLMFFIKSFSNL